MMTNCHNISIMIMTYFVMVIIYHMNLVMNHYLNNKLTNCQKMVIFYKKRVLITL